MESLWNKTIYNIIFPSFINRTLGGIASICFRFHFQQTLRIQIQGSQGCQKIRKIVRSSKLPIARATKEQLIRVYFSFYGPYLELGSSKVSKTFLCMQELDKWMVWHIGKHTYKTGTIEKVWNVWYRVILIMGFPALQTDNQNIKTQL